MRLSGSGGSSWIDAATSAFASAFGGRVAERLRKLASFWSQDVNRTERLARLQTLQPFGSPKVLPSKHASDANQTPTHYRITDPAYSNWYLYGANGIELGYFETIAHLDKRLKDAGWSDQYAWLPSGAPKEMLTLLMANGMYGLMSPSASVGSSTSFAAMLDAVAARHGMKMSIMDPNAQKSGLDKKTHAGDPGAGNDWDDDEGVRYQAD